MEAGRGRGWGGGVRLRLQEEERMKERGQVSRRRGGDKVQSEECRAQSDSGLQGRGGRGGAI